MKKIELKDFRQVFATLAEKCEMELPEDFDKDDKLSQAKLKQDLGLDSLDLIELEMELEKISGGCLPADFSERHGETVGEYIQAFNAFVS